jgi:hypothetical protein
MNYTIRVTNQRGSATGGCRRELKNIYSKKFLKLLLGVIFITIALYSSEEMHKKLPKYPVIKTMIQC